MAGIAAPNQYVCSVGLRADAPDTPARRPPVPNPSPPHSGAAAVFDLWVIPTPPLASRTEQIPSGIRKRVLSHESAPVDTDVTVPP